MVAGEREMVRELAARNLEKAPESEPEERFTSLQATYEDSVAPGEEWEWEDAG